MASPSTHHEVEDALRRCKDLCISCLDSPELAPPVEEIGNRWGQLLDHLSATFQRLPPTPTGSGVHNWVVFQETRTLLSATWAWPAHLQPLLPSYWAAINRAVTRKRTRAQALPPTPSVAPEHHPEGPTLPAPAYAQQWTRAVIRKHRRLLADALAYLRLKPSAEEDNPCDQVAMADSILRSFDDSHPVSWPEEVAQQHPHPMWEHLDNLTPIESINVTSLKAAEELLLRRHAPIFLQEHALPACVHRGWIKRARGRGYTLILSPPDPEAAVAKGGVAVLAPVDYRATEMPARSQAFCKARALGRVMRVVLRTGLHCAVTVYNVYGFPGAHHDRSKALRTDCILTAIMEEVEAWGDSCVAIVGDLNADLEDLPSIQAFFLQRMVRLGLAPGVA